jgi:hypothetical protein
MGRGSTRIARINLFTSWQAQEWHGFDTGDGSGEGCFDVADPSTGLRAGPSTGLRAGPSTGLRAAFNERSEVVIPNLPKVRGWIEGEGLLP